MGPGAHSAGYFKTAYYFTHNERLPSQTLERSLEDLVFSAGTQPHPSLLDVVLRYLYPKLRKVRRSIALLERSYE